MSLARIWLANWHFWEQRGKQQEVTELWITVLEWKLEYKTWNQSEKINDYNGMTVQKRMEEQGLWKENLNLNKRDLWHDLEWDGSD